MELEHEASRKGASQDNVILKLLVPSVAAGAIIGKGGEAIAQVQKDFGAKVKMSKTNDFYPGTTERVCLIQGSLESVRSVCEYVMEKILEKPDPNPRLAGDGKLNVERHKQVKILVPNSTAGMVIGKKGAHIKEIMDRTGAYVQVSQKPKEQALSERCVIIAGDPDANKTAVSQILNKVAEDPASGSCPSISYATVAGPVASAYPTGSPYAGSGMATRTGASAGANAGASSVGVGVGPHNQAGVSLNSSQSSFSSISIENLRMSLRNSGYNDVAADDIANAMQTLANYGFFNLQSLLPGGGGLSPMPLVASPHSSLSLQPGSLSALAPLHDSGRGGVGGGADFGGGGGGGGGGGFAEAAPFLLGSSAPPPPTMFDTQFAAALPLQDSDNNQPLFKSEFEIPEPLVGAIIGPSGKDIAELQAVTRTSIQVAKRSEISANSRMRAVGITGAQANVVKAEQMIKQRVQQEDSRRQQLGGQLQQRQM